MGERAEPDKLRLKLAEVALASLGGVDSEGEHADPETECPPPSNFMHGVVQVAKHLSISCSASNNTIAKSAPRGIEAVLCRRSGRSVQMLLEGLAMEDTSMMKIASTDTSTM